MLFSILFCVDTNVENFSCCRLLQHTLQPLEQRPAKCAFGQLKREWSTVGGNRDEAISLNKCDRHMMSFIFFQNLIRNYKEWNALIMNLLAISMQLCIEVFITESYTCRLKNCCNLSLPKRSSDLGPKTARSKKAKGTLFFKKNNTNALPSKPSCSSWWGTAQSRYLGRPPMKKEAQTTLDLLS